MAQPDKKTRQGFARLARVVCREVIVHCGGGGKASMGVSGMMLLCFGVAGRENEADCWVCVGVRAPLFFKTVDAGGF